MQIIKITGISNINEGFKNCNAYYCITQSTRFDINKVFSQAKSNIIILSLLFLFIFPSILCAINSHEEISAKSSQDQVRRITQDGDQLILHDLVVGIGESRTLVEIKDLKLDMGKRYAVTGQEGCGKRVLLALIKEAVDKDRNVVARGDIYYPRINGGDPKILMIRAQDFPVFFTLQQASLWFNEIPSDKSYFPSEFVAFDEFAWWFRRMPSDDVLKWFNPVERKMLINLWRSRIPIIDSYFSTESALKEFDYWVHKFPKGKIAWDDAKKKEIREILGELKIFDEQILNLDDKRLWGEISSGEKRKVMLALAIIEKPDILILSSSALYLRDRGNVQETLKKYLPHTLILVIDHYMKENNKNNFYDKELNIANKRATIKDILVSSAV